MLKTTEIPVVTEPLKIDQRTDWMNRHDKVVLDRVKRGLALLQEKHGDNWVDFIDPKKLSMGSCTYCVVGQIYGDYTEGRGILNIDSGVEFGFDRGRDENITYSALDEAWLDAYYATKGE